MIEIITEKEKNNVKNIASKLLKENVCEIVFKKVDGTERVMKCTLLDNYIEQKEKSNKKINKTDSVYSVWDIENNGWRSFRWDSLKNLQVLKDEQEETTSDKEQTESRG